MLIRRNNSQQLIYMGNASIPADHVYINLTPDPYATLNVSNETASNVVFPRMIGRVLYRQPVTMWPASFTTVFTIFVKPKVFNGDGLAFIIVPNNKSFLPRSYGSMLGVYDQSTDGNTTGQLAIEFDTYKNRFDPDSNHVGIDTRGTTSDSTAGMGEQGIDIKAGRAIQVRVHYDGRAKSLQIYARYANSSSPYASILNHTVELENTVPRSAYVGFAASTGNSYEWERERPEDSVLGSKSASWRDPLQSEEIRRVLILGLACSHPDPQLRPSMRRAIQVLMNPNEELPQLPSTRPMAIYVVLPPVGAVFSQSTLSSLVPESSNGTITTSVHND
ncbi:hypothetical protein SUGI_0645990 [Cryptomeria japonica]|nr:hypothetical protein SUGI_0645990 [Cryptomeria japonica]